MSKVLVTFNGETLAYRVKVPGWLAAEMMKLAARNTTTVTLKPPKFLQDKTEYNRLAKQRQRAKFDILVAPTLTKETAEDE